MWWQQGGSDQPINPEYEQEARLVEQARSGSERAFAALLARYQQPVFRLIYYLVGSEDEARELTRVVLKHALLHMPRVPAGHSVRPWVLRVATLVALDTVRQRSESPQALLADLRLPEPPGPSRIVDADPLARSLPQDTAMRALERDPNATIAQAWEALPVDIERELVRRLLAGLPDGDAEVLALGVVGQIPTRDLAALAGTSERGIRRRIARALILFQTRYEVVWQNALPAAPPTKELNAAAGADTFLDSAIRGVAGMTDRMRRSLRGDHPASATLTSQARLETLRATPDQALATPDLPPTTRRPITPPAAQPAPAAHFAPLVDEMPTVIIPPAPSAPVEREQPAALPAWTVLPPDLAAVETVVVGEPRTSTPADQHAEPPTVGVAPDARLSALGDATAFDPAITIPPTAARKLPRFGPPPDELVDEAPPTASAAAVIEFAASPEPEVAAPMVAEADVAAPLEPEADVAAPLAAEAGTATDATVAGEVADFAPAAVMEASASAAPPEAVAEPAPAAEIAHDAPRPEQAGDAMPDAPAIAQPPTALEPEMPAVQEAAPAISADHEAAPAVVAIHEAAPELRDTLSDMAEDSATPAAAPEAVAIQDATPEVTASSEDAPLAEAARPTVVSERSTVTISREERDAYLSRHRPEWAEDAPDNVPVTAAPLALDLSDLAPRDHAAETHTPATPAPPASAIPPPAGPPVVEPTNVVAALIFREPDVVPESVVTGEPDTVPESVVARESDAVPEPVVAREPDTVPEPVVAREPDAVPEPVATTDEVVEHDAPEPTVNPAATSLAAGDSPRAADAIPPATPNRPLSRPMPRLNRDLVEPPPSW